MFILPSNDRDSVLNSALEGLSRSGHILGQHTQERSSKEALKRLRAGNLDLGSILGSGLDPKVTNALIQHLTERGSGSAKGSAHSSVKSGDSGRGVDSNINGMGLESAEHMEGERQATSQPFKEPFAEPFKEPEKAKKYDFLDLSPQFLEETMLTRGSRGVANLERQVNTHNKRVEYFVNKNEPAVASVYEHANSGRDLVQNADMLEELVKSGDLQHPLSAWFSELVGLPVSALGDVNDEVFSKITNSLLGPYLKQNYAGLGRVLQSEVQSQKQAIVSAKNSDEAKQILINLIRDLGNSGLDAEKDYAQVVNEHGIGDPELRKHLNEVAHERWENTPVSFLLSDGRNILIKRKDREAVQKEDAQLARQSLQNKINNSPPLDSLHLPEKQQGNKTEAEKKKKKHPTLGS